MLVAQVIIDVSTRSLNKAFDYIVPRELSNLTVGCVVAVEFGTRPVAAYVIKLHEESEQELEARTYRLKPIAGILSESYFDEESALVARWISSEYLAPVADAFNLFTPPGGHPKIKRNQDTWSLVYPAVGPVDDRWIFLADKASGFIPAKNAHRQAMVIDALSSGGMRAAELSAQLGNVNSTIKALEKKGVIRVEYKRRYRDAMTALHAPQRVHHALTDEQQHALNVITKMSNSKITSYKERVVLIDGVTGSGKTEVYLRSIESELKKGKDAIVLVPEISLTPQTVGRFRAYFGEQVAVLHSKLSDGERFDQWDLIRSGYAHVVVGARSALFAPVKNLGIIIIDEEHETSYKQESSPRYVARDVARQIIKAKQATLVLGSATPSIDTLAHCKGGILDVGWKRVAMKTRPCGQSLPTVQVVDMAEEFKRGQRSMFSQPLRDALLAVVEKKEKAVLFLNKRGFASFMLCRDCGYVPECPHCSVSLTYHEVGNKLVCHHCGYEKQAPTLCPTCLSPYLRKFGTGTQRVEAELASFVPQGVAIIRMDADTTKRKGAHEKLLEQFAQCETGILLGTQMIAKGLDFADVTLVGVVIADTVLNLPDYRSPERCYQLIEQVSGRAGRAEKKGHVIVQTYHVDHPSIRAAQYHNRTIFLESDMQERKKLRFPPYVRLANVLLWGTEEAHVIQRATELKLAITSAVFHNKLDWEVFDAAPCIFQRIQKNYRWHILIKAPVKESFEEILKPIMSKHHKKRSVHCTVDVDPTSLF